MAINKNFVIKNGVEVNTNLLVGDSTLNKVGIATTVPGYTLHIGVGAGDRGGIGATDLTVTGVATIGTQNSTSGALNVGGISTFSGDIFVGSGATIQANGNAAFAGITTVGSNLLVGGDLTVDGDYSADEITARNLFLTGIATIPTLGVTGIGTFEKLTVGTGVTLQEHGGVSIAGITTIGGNLLAGGDILPDEDGSRDLGSSSKEFQDLFIDGTANIDSLAADTAAIGDLSNNSVVIVTNDSGELGDSSNLTFDGSTLAVTGKETVSVDVTVGTGVTVQRHGGVSIAGITTIGGVTSINNDNEATNTTSGSLIVAGGLGLAKSLFVGGALDVTSNSSLKGNVDLGDATSDTITATGRFDSNLVPSTNNTRDLGTSSNQWKDLFIDGTAILDNASVGFATFSQNVNISGVTTTGENLGGFKRLVGAASSTVVSIAVTVATKTSDHRYFGQGSNNGYWLDGVESPFLTLVPGKLYYFDQSHSTNSGHPLRFYLEQDKANSYTTEITTGGTAGSSGAYTQIGIGTASNENNHPAVLHYQCSQHALMGNAVATQSNVVNLGDAVHSRTRGGLTIGGNLIPDSDDQRNIGAAGSEFKDLHLDGTANIDTLSADTVKVTDLTAERVVIAGTSGELEDSSNLTFDGTQLATHTLNAESSVNAGSGATMFANGNLAIAGFSTFNNVVNIQADATFVAAGSSTILFDASAHSLIFQDNIRAKFGTGSDLSIYHDGSDNYIDGNSAAEDHIYIRANVGSDQSSNIHLQAKAGEESIVCRDDEQVELYFNGNLKLKTTNDGVLVGTASTIGGNGNAVFAGITTLGSPLSDGIPSEIIARQRITAKAGANFESTGITTIANAYITKLAQSNGTSGNANEVPVANGAGGWNWQPANTTGVGDITGITVREEGSNVGTANSITILNFVGNDVTADATANQGICTITVDSNIAGINTIAGSFLHDIQISGVTTITSDSQTAINVGSATTLYQNGNVKTVGVVTANGGIVVGTGGSIFIGSAEGGVSAASSLHKNGNAAFSGIVTAGGGFNIGIQSAGIVIAKNVGINTLNFVGSGNSITYFAATNTLDVSIAGSSGGGGGVSETETAVSSTNATGVGSFAISGNSGKRSASILAQITQGSNYQVGRYLMIHDGTTVTVIEESAVATGSMLGSFNGDINNSNAEFKVTMLSSSSATVTTKIDTISIP